MHVTLLIIDPQVDFCDPHKGALYVGGAEHDAARLAAMVRRLGPTLDDIHVTLDSHHFVDIAHPVFWRDAQGQPPAPFTTITTADVEEGRWTTAQPSMRPRALDYVRALDARGRYGLTVWPPHCLIGGAGHALMPDLSAALAEWERGRFAPVDYVLKGSNIFTEHYSAIQAEVPDPADPGTQVNTALVQSLMRADLVAVGGEAGSHCVANTVRDLVDSAGGDSFASKLVLLSDAVSPVSGFEAFQAEFVRDMTARGMRLSATTDFLTGENKQMAIEFYRERDEPFGVFSNFSPHGFEIDGVLWRTVGDYFQAMKFVGTPHEDAVRRAGSPMDAKTMGNDRSRPLRPDWDAVKDDVMRRAVRAKFAQHPDICAVLLGTGDEDIIEAAHNDAYWGWGPDRTGKNMLGKILMEVRDEMRRL